MFVFLSLQILALVSVFIVIKSWSRCGLVILQPRMGGGGALRKDSLKDKHHSILRHSCHLVSILLFRVNALFFCGHWWRHKTCLLIWLPFALLCLPRPPASPCSGPPYCPLRHCFFGCVTIIIHLSHIYWTFTLCWSMLQVWRTGHRTQWSGSLVNLCNREGDR